MARSAATPFFDIPTLKVHIPGLPDMNLSHIQRLTNNVGIMQHARYATPNYHHGYCLDDNARALMLTSMIYELWPSNEIKNLMSTYLAYINYMQAEDGKFRNFLSFDHQFLDEEGTEDSFGRTIWALGTLLRITTLNDFIPLSRELFIKALPHITQLRSPRAVAYSLLGLLHYDQRHPQDKEVWGAIKSLSYYLVDEYRQNSYGKWYWYEKIITYDNAVIPLSLLRSAQLLEDDAMLKIGLQSAGFLDSLLFENDYLSTIGNKEWYFHDGIRSTFGQQAVEIPSIILLYKQLCRMTQEAGYSQRMLDSFAWFFGKNILGLSVYDKGTGGCHDGLDSHGVNMNQGAESTMSFWLAYIYMCSSFN
ncbi:hypothetical protein G5B30_07225 [Sphingobacterium sp. SGG-5]|uniref:hypothetical protein n=1 Tax=Sphingobacterium sp. SGG-5 TaxID=2710881 RepID=UPI0013EC3187|nr:hypothetical protein [Sphingobacterium sp. SGG-5]NGM61707.1 hypothetical protein [Sphingobacterium sp. SGG-5]